VIIKESESESESDSVSAAVPRRCAEEVHRGPDVRYMVAVAVKTQEVVTQCSHPTGVGVRASKSSESSRGRGDGDTEHTRDTISRPNLRNEVEIPRDVCRTWDFLLT